MLAINGFLQTPLLLQIKCRWDSCYWLIITLWSNMLMCVLILIRWSGGWNGKTRCTIYWGINSLHITSVIAKVPLCFEFSKILKQLWWSSNSWTNCSFAFPHDWCARLLFVSSDNRSGDDCGSQKIMQCWITEINWRSRQGTTSRAWDYGGESEPWGRMFRSSSYTSSWW